MPVGIFITFVRDRSRRRNCLSPHRITRTNVRNAALILKRKIFFWPNNAAGRNGFRGRRVHALGKTADVIEMILTGYRILRRVAV